MLLAFALLAGCQPRLETTPPTVSFAGRTYEVSYAALHGPCFSAAGVVVRCFDAGTLIVHDFTGDGTPDLGMYVDERDGWQVTFSYLDIYANGGTSLATVEPDHAKWKEGDWAWIDRTRYPGLYADRFRRFMCDQDESHDWF
jgi:hypothetical protein